MAQEILLDSVRFVLGSWTVLKLAIQHGFGGTDSEDKAEWLVDVTNQVLRDNETIEYYELADYIEEILYNEFHTVVEDGSLPKVAQKLCSIHQLWKDGHLAQIQEEMQSIQTPKLRQCELGTSKGKSDEDGDDEMEEEKRNAVCDGHFESDKNENSTRVTQQFDQLHISENALCELANSSSQRSGDQGVNGKRSKKENYSAHTELTPEDEDGWEVVRRSKRR